MEPFALDDINFYPCACRYQVRRREGEEGKYRRVLLLESRGEGRKREGRYSIQLKCSVLDGKRRKREGGTDGGKLW